ncbi:NBR1-Ig-like domain-containing protein [Amycolatopsis halotolerans]|uniref:NBR1-Ig-like domain-containing protein n=1 Tax=Amycolatopsis halotolerans TaxID=330083 RepID=A0ABV7QPK0_9PSEU
MSEPAAGQPQARRGRKHIVPDAGAGPVSRFACGLLDLKREAGDPSYDRMRTELGAVASKSALSAATRGRSAPSWPTTWEFVRSLAVTGLGRDEETVRREWLARWEEAVEGQSDPAWAASAGSAGETDSPDQAFDTSAHADPPGAGDWSAVDAASPVESHPAEPFSTPPWEPAKTRRWGSIVVAATVLVVLGLVAAVVVLATPSSRDKEAAAPHYPLPGDSSGFGGDGLSGDVTFPDGAKTRYGRTFTKIWRLKNTGSVPWRSRFLQVAGGTTVLCPSPPRVPVPDAEPGQLVEVSVPVKPTGTGVCHVLWKMVDERGALVFPDRTGIFYQVTVAVE